MEVMIIMTVPGIKMCIRDRPYTMQNVLQYGGAYYVCGTGRQTLVKDKTANDNYYLLTLAALAQEIRKRKGGRTAKVVLAAGLPLTGFGREKQRFKAVSYTHLDVYKRQVNC